MMIENNEIEISPLQFRVIISRFGLRKTEWYEIARELKEFGFIDSISKKIIMVNR